MRKHHFSPGGAFSAIVLFLLLSAATVMAADSTSCVPDCPADTFGIEQREVLQLPGGCWVRVTWAKRFACGMYHDVIIKSVEPLTDGCGGRTLKQLLDEATKALLEKNPMWFPPLTNDTCVINWRVVRGACWSYKVECGDTIAAPCDLTECCLTPYEVCIDSAGKRTVTPMGSGPGASCDSTSGCVPVCGSGGGGGVASPGSPEISAANGLKPLLREAVLPRRARVTQ